MGTPKQSETSAVAVAAAAATAAVATARRRQSQVHIKAMPYFGPVIEMLCSCGQMTQQTVAPTDRE